MKHYTKTILVLCICLFSFLLVKAQNNLVLAGGHVNMTDNYLTLNNTTFTNNGTFQSGSGTVTVIGNAGDAQSQIGGSSSTTFYNLIINKSANNALLGQNATISNQLTLSSGKLEIGNHNLTIGNTGNISGQNQERYIVTNGTGTLLRQVGNTWTAFPVGNSTFNPARLKNDGTLDNFNIRVEDQHLQNGTSGNAVTTNVIPRTWLIEEGTVGGSDVSMQLVWRPTHASTGFNPNTSQIAHYTGGQWNDLGTPSDATDDNTYSSDHKYQEATNITSFSPFGVRSNTTALPVELLYFYGQQQGENVLLNWETVTEMNNSHFEVEWSTNGLAFQKIGEVQGAGTTTETQLYDFLHENPIDADLAVQHLYYRIKQVDLDGKFEYTNTIQITIHPSNYSTVKIFPNPATDYFNVEAPNSIGETIQIFNVKGQLIKEFQHQSSVTKIPINNLLSGTYFVKIGDEVKKVIIQ